MHESGREKNAPQKLLWTHYLDKSFVSCVIHVANVIVSWQTVGYSEENNKNVRSKEKTRTNRLK